MNKSKTPSAVGLPVNQPFAILATETRQSIISGRWHVPIDWVVMDTTIALLLIDMQLVAFDGEITPPISDGDALLESVSDLTNHCRQTGIPVVYVQTTAESGRPYAKDVHGWEIHPLLTPRTGDHVVLKRNSSGFDDTNLNDVLRNLGVETLIISGIWSQHCVANTSTDAASIGFKVLLVADAHGTVASSEADAADIVEQQNRRLSAESNISVLTRKELDRLLQAP